jgi:DnaJ-class molecular chaperone
MNYYHLLGVAADADQKTIRRAFRNLARQFHPDAGEGSSPEKFRQLVDAYETLSDPKRRQAYDRSLFPSQLRRGDPIPPGPHSFFGPRRDAPPAMRVAAQHRVHSTGYRPPSLFDLVDEIFRSLEEEFPFGPSFFGW